MILGALSWPLLFAFLGLSSALIVTLHLLRLREQKIEVPHVALFEESLGSSDAARRIDWLRRLLALLLSLFIAAAITLSLGEPERAGETKGIARVLVIDQSLSMEAIDAWGRSRRERALEIAREWIEKKARGEAMAILAMDHVPITLSGLTRDRDTLLTALGRSRPGWGRAATSETLELARELLREEERAEILMLSDTPVQEIEQMEASPAEAPQSARILSVRTFLIADPGENLALAEIAARRLPSDPSRVQTLVRIENHGPSERRARLNLSSSAGLIESRSITLAPFKSERLYFDDLPLIDGRIDAALIPEDSLLEALRLDDHGSVAITPRERVRAHLITDGNLYIEAALLLDPSIELTTSRPGDELPQDLEGLIDLYLVDAAEVELPPSVPAIVFLDPRADSSAMAPIGALIPRPPIRPEREEDPIVRGARLYETNIKEARALRAQRHDRILARAANQPIIALMRRDGRETLVFGFQIEESDLPLRAAFPLLLMRGIDELLNREVRYRPPHKQYETVELYADAAELSLKRLGDAEASAKILHAPDGRARFLPEAPGVYLVEAFEANRDRAESAPQEIVIARAALEESSISQAKTDAESDGAREAEGAEIKGARSSGRLLALPSLLTLLLVGGLALLIAESALYHLRWIE